MSAPYTNGKALFEHLKELYMQYRFGTVQHGVSKNELAYAIEIMEIMAGKYGECAGIPSEEYMCELLEKAAQQKRKVGYIQHTHKRIDAATGMDIVSEFIDNSGYIGIL